MTQWRGWLTMLAVWCLLWVVGCSDSALDDSVSEVQPGTEPTLVELGLRLAPPGFSVAGLSAADMVQVARGSYLVNGASGGCSCHTTESGYLAGGLPFPLPFTDVQGVTTVVSRNLTPDPETGMTLTEAEFIETMRTGKDFHDSTATQPQRLIVMPWQVYRFMATEDLQAIYAYLRRIPPIRHAVVAPQLTVVTSTTAPPCVAAPARVARGAWVGATVAAAHETTATPGHSNNGQ